MVFLSVLSHCPDGRTAGRAEGDREKKKREMCREEEKEIENAKDKEKRGLISTVIGLGACCCLDCLFC